MESRPEDKEASSRPKDRSLEAYKAWMTEIINRLTTDKTGLGLTEQEWAESWKEYWRQHPQS